MKALLLISPVLLPLLTLVAVSLFVAGGIGNLIDRLANDGRVIDFMQVGVGWLRTGVFNVADMAITLGAACLLASSLPQRRRKEPVRDQG